MEDICYGKIKGNYYYGLYGDLKVIIMKSNGYINATKLCKDGGKRFENWLKIKKSKILVEQFEQFLLQAAGISDRCIIKIDNEEVNLLQGTYVHRNLILRIASWISSLFAYKVSMIVNNFIIYQSKNEFIDKIKEREAQIEELNKRLRISNMKYDVIKEVSLKTMDPSI